MIVSFGDRQTEAFFNRERVKRFDPRLQTLAVRKLWMLHAAEKLDDLRTPPGNRLEALKGDRQGQFSIRVNDQWRIVFAWLDDRAHDVTMVDYH